jgi:histidinol-phosphate aminotransferase
MTIVPKLVVRNLQEYSAPPTNRYSSVRLDFNENTEGFPDVYPKGLPSDWVSAYPEYSDLTKRLAEFHRLPEDYLLLTNGSDEAISLVSSTFIEPGIDTAVISIPCFFMIPQCLKIAGADLRQVKLLEDLNFDLTGIEEAMRDNAKLAMFASPDNPTGSVLPTESILDLCHRFPDTLIVIDEAYAEYAETSLIPYLQDTPNLLVLRTFSKAWGMAGLRLGMCLGNPALLDYLRLVRLPYSVNAAAVWTAIRLLETTESVRSSTRLALARKEALIQALKERDYDVSSAAGNFLLLSAESKASKLTGYLKSRGILVRNRCPGKNTIAGARSRTNPLWGKVRISVGTQRENESLLSALDSFQEQCSRSTCKKAINR